MMKKLIMLFASLIFSTNLAFAGTVGGGDYEIHQNFGYYLKLRFLNSNWSDCGTKWIQITNFDHVVYLVKASKKREQIKINYHCGNGAIWADNVGPRY